MSNKECLELPELSLNLKEGVDDTYTLLQEIRPEWGKDSIQIQVLSGGYSCHMLRCSHDSGQSVAVRVRNNYDGLRDPKLEPQIVKAMSSNGCFPHLLALFQNGYCYEYIPGTPVYAKGAPQVNVDEEQIRVIAQEMANIHSVMVPGFDYSRATIFDFVVGLLSKAKPRFQGFSPVEELIQEVRLVEDFVSHVPLPLVHVHCDPHPGNLVWNEEQKKITFVDWELSQVAPRAYDIIYFINSLDFFGLFMNIPVSKPADIKRKFCVHYLTRWNEINNKSLPTEDEIEQLMMEIKYSALVTEVVVMAYVVIFEDVMSTRGQLDSIWEYNYNRYTTAKEKFFGTKPIGPPPAKHKK